MNNRFTFKGTSLSVNRMGYGAMQLPGANVWGPPRNKDGALAVLRKAVQGGVDHIDTADFYGPHVSNRLIREALAPYPKNLVIVTKIGFLRGEDASWYQANKADDLARAVESNLETLGLGALELVNLRLGASHEPNDESIKAPLLALAALQRRGLVRHIGLSTITLSQYQEAIGIADIVCVQNHYNLAHRADDALIDRLASDGVAYVPYFPLGGFSPLQSTVLSEVAATLSARPLQVALAWLLQRAPNIVLIPGTSSIDHLQENMAAASLQLPLDLLRRLDTIGRA
jgi:pyridoxine 4-dehydrogenase